MLAWAISRSGRPPSPDSGGAEVSADQDSAAGDRIRLAQPRGERLANSADVEFAVSPHSDGEIVAAETGDNAKPASCKRATTPLSTASPAA